MRKHSTIEHTPDDLCMGRFDSEAANRPAIGIDDIKIGTKNTDRRIAIQPFNLASQALGERDVVRILARNKPSLSGGKRPIKRPRTSQSRVDRKSVGEVKSVSERI